ncbi:MAG: formate/nitrite transporter family protein [Muribaculaceae bacterium]|nr:formate/nitrite transporter family protein [Muribaculaceae bacterium]
MRILSPSEIQDSAIEAGSRKAALTRSSNARLVVSAILAGCYIAFGGIFSVIMGQGFPGAAEQFPALPRLMSGLAFPIGLTLVVVLGAELFTGNNALLASSYLAKRHSAMDVVRNWTIVYFGNLVGAVAFAYLMVVACGLTAVEPYHSGLIKMATAKVSMPWITVFLKGIGANWCVCLAVWLALSGKTLVEKALGCWIPVALFVALGYEHCIANMFFIPCAMMEGADISVGTFVWNNLIPATIGNIVGGALLVGCVYGWMHRKKANQ